MVSKLPEEEEEGGLWRKNLAFQKHTYKMPGDSYSVGEIVLL